MTGSHRLGDRVGGIVWGIVCLLAGAYFFFTAADKQSVRGQPIDPNATYHVTTRYVRSGRTTESLQTGNAIIGRWQVVGGFFIVLGGVLIWANRPRSGRT